MDALKLLADWAVAVNDDLSIWDDEDDEDVIARRNNEAMATVMGALGVSVA